MMEWQIPLKVHIYLICAYIHRGIEIIKNTRGARDRASWWCRHRQGLNFNLNTTKNSLYFQETCAHTRAYIHICIYTYMLYTVHHWEETIWGKEEEQWGGSMRGRWTLYEPYEPYDYEPAAMIHMYRSHESHYIVLLKADRQTKKWLFVGLISCPVWLLVTSIWVVLNVEAKLWKYDQREEPFN